MQQKFIRQDSLEYHSKATLTPLRFSSPSWNEVYKLNSHIFRVS